MKALTVIGIALLLLGVAGFSYSCGLSARPNVYVRQAPATPITPAPYVPPAASTSTTTPSQQSFSVDMSSARVSNEFNPENDTTSKKFDFTPQSVNGYQVYLLGGEFHDQFYLLFKSQLAITDINYDGDDFQTTTKPQYLQMAIDGPPGKDYLFGLPLAAEQGTITVYYQP